jgi:alpha-tubulin suppressor-like RCC1 family protein
MSVARCATVVVFAMGATVAMGPWAALHAQQPRRLPVISGMMGINVLVDVDGTVKSWGGPAADAGFYGDGSQDGETRRVPKLIPGVANIIDAAVGYDHALLLKSDGTVLGWGRNNGCALALPDDHRRYTPVPLPGLQNVRQVAAGVHFSAAVLNDGTVRVWGENAGGLLANGKSGYREDCAKAPVPVEGLTGVKRLIVGERNVLVLKEDGTVWGWGANSDGQLCDGTTERRNRPVQMKGIANAVDVDSDGNTVIVVAGGTVWMCGKANDASMANAPNGSVHSTPFQIAGITTAVAARIAGTPMVRLKDGTLLGWGYGMHGSLGDGFVDKITPAPHAPIGLGPVLAHFYASNEGYAVRADGTVMAWGFYTDGPVEWALKPVLFFKVTLGSQ